MNEGSGSSSVFAWGAVCRGALWGLTAIILGAVLQGMIAHASPISAAAETVMSLVWQAVGGLAGGFMAARRAPGTGWLHGALAGLLLSAAILVVNGIATAWPPLMSLLKIAALAGGAGALGGVVGVNTRS